MLVGILGVLKSGGAYVPIDPSFPKERINYIIKDSGLRILLSDNKSRSRVSKKAGLINILLDSYWDLISKESTQSINRIASEEQLAYVMYTSGSTCLLYTSPSPRDS